jgi:hypothetical protein
MSDIIIVISGIVKPFQKSPTAPNFFLSLCQQHPRRHGKSRYNSAMNMTPMTPFMKRFPQLAASETRSVTVTGRDDLPDGEYGFIEFYCNEPQCDCLESTP